MPKRKRKKGQGFWGKLQRPGGGVSTELSIGVNFDGKDIEIPSLVPTLTIEEVNYLLHGNEPTSGIVDKAVAHARQRMRKRKNPFAQQGEIDRLSQMRWMANQWLGRNKWADKL